MTDFFISYAREDKAYAQALVARLKALKWDVWIDENDIPPSVPWRMEIRRAIEESMMIVVVESADWTASDACHIELDFAEQSHTPIVRIVPDLAALDEHVGHVVAAYKTLPDSRGIALAAAASAAVWSDSGRPASLRARGRSALMLRGLLRRFPQEFSPTAAAYIRASALGAVHRIVTGLVLGLVIPVLVFGIIVSVAVVGRVNYEVSEAVTDATAYAERDAYRDWNVYASIERAAADVSEDYSRFRELFLELTDLVPSEWDPAPVTAPGPLTATSVDGSLIAAASGPSIEVISSTGRLVRLLATSEVVALDWSPDGRWIAAATIDGGNVLSVENGQVMRLRGGSGASATVHWTDDTHVAIGSSSGTGTWQVFDRSWSTTVPSGIRYAASLDGTMYSVDESGAVTAIDLADGSTWAMLPAVDEGRPTSMDAAAGRVVIAYTSGDTPYLRVVDVARAEYTDLPMPDCPPLGISITPDASAAYLACATVDTNETRVDLTTGGIVAAPFQVAQVYGVRVLDGRVLWGSLFGGTFQSSLDLAPGGLVTGQTGCGVATRKYIGASDGSPLFPIGDGTGARACAMRLDLGASADIHRLIFNAEDGRAVPDAAMSADEGLIAYGLSDGQIRVFSTQQFDPIVFAQVLPDQVRAVAFTADGDQVIIAGLGGQVVSIPIPYRTQAEGAQALIDEAVARGQRAIDWGIYRRTLDMD